MKKCSLFLILLFITTAELSSLSTRIENLKEYVSTNKLYKFKIKYNFKLWSATTDTKPQRNSRFKDILILYTQDRINQIRVGIYKGLDAPIAKGVAQLLEGEFFKDEIAPGEQVQKFVSKKLKQSLISSSGANDGWKIGFLYYDRREGQLYNIYYIFYKKVTIPSSRPGRPALVTGKAFILRCLIKKSGYGKIIKEINKVVRSFSFN
jgi:hypothetical protein